MNQGVLSATAAHEGLRPVRMEERIDLVVVTSNSTEMEKHAQEKHEAQGK
jgi:SpoU rRNA methylase family enzyme